MRVGPVRVSGPELDRALQRVAAVRMLGAGAVDLSGLPAARVRALARYGLGAKAQSLRRLAEPRRTATLVATVAARSPFPGCTNQAMGFGIHWGQESSRLMPLLGFDHPAHARFRDAGDFGNFPNRAALTGHSEYGLLLD